MSVFPRKCPGLPVRINLFRVGRALHALYWLRTHICLLSRAQEPGWRIKPNLLSPSPQIWAQCFVTQLKGNYDWRRCGRNSDKARNSVTMTIHSQVGKLPTAATVSVAPACLAFGTVLEQSISASPHLNRCAVLPLPSSCD